MLTLIVDEAYAFDYLAILRIKVSPLAIDIATHLESQLGAELFNRIMDSAEFRDVYAANLRVFDAVDRARYGATNAITANELDSVNMGRHHAKRALQQAFFDNDLTEKKT